MAKVFNVQIEFERQFLRHFSRIVIPSFEVNRQKIWTLADQARNLAKLARLLRFPGRAGFALVTFQLLSSSKTRARWAKTQLTFYRKIREFGESAGLSAGCDGCFPGGSKV